jgi:hypothetical protein
MGAFGNYSYNPKPKTDFSQLRTIPVIATFNAEGKIRPDYFRITNTDQSVDTYKIDTVKYTKDYDNRIVFYCLFTNGKRQQEVNLVFYVMECIWTVNT